MTGSQLKHPPAGSDQVQSQVLGQEVETFSHRARRSFSESGQIRTSFVLCVLFYFLIVVESHDCINVITP